MRKFSDIEDAIVTRLAPLNVAGKIRVSAWPETEDEFTKPVQGARIYAQAMSMTPSDNKDTNYTIQPAMLGVNVIIMANKLRGNGFCWQLEQATRLLLIGFQPSDANRLKLVRGGVIAPEYIQNMWTYQLEFFCETQLVQQEADDDTIAGVVATITQITNESSFGQVVTTDDEIDGGFPITEFDDEYDGGNP